MNEINLSQRLHTVAQSVSKGSVVADIGSDHAYLPCYLCLNEIALRAVAGEVVEGPYYAALEQVQKLNLEDKISVRKGDGLEVISPGEVDVAVIAGMGGKLIADILERGQPKLTGVTRLVLQPNVSAEAVRLWLMRNDWQLIHEEILEEDGKIYEVLVSERGDGNAPYKTIGGLGFRYGPFLMKDKNNAFRKKWRAETAKWQRIEAQLDQATQAEEIVNRKRQLRRKINETEEMLND